LSASATASRAGAVSRAEGLRPIAIGALLDYMADWQTIVTSAAVGAGVSALANLVGQWRERTARRRELLFSAAIEMAYRRTDLAIRVSERNGKDLELTDSMFLAEGYFRALTGLVEQGAIPREFHQKQTESRAELDARKADRPRS
jgi:hypothetical protein